MSDAANDRPAGPHAWPAERLGWYAVLVLSLAYVLSYLDRIVISLLIGPIKADLALSDTEFGALQSLAFGLFYTLLALPLGRLADARSRRAVVAAGVAVFSLFTFLSGTARGYWELFVARVGVGAGEASVTPAAYSMIGDYFPPHRLGRAIGVFSLSAFVGVGAAYIAGGTVIAALEGLDLAGVPFLERLRPWQLAFVAISLPGLLMVPLIFTIREPLRRHVLAGAAASLPVRTVVAELWRRRAALGWLIGGFSLVALSGYASLAWIPAFFMRTYGWTSAEVGFAYGSIYLLFGSCGAWCSGWLCDRLSARGVLDAPLRVAAFAFVGTAVFGGLAPLMPTPQLALVLLVPYVLMATAPYPMAGTAIQLVVPGALRGQASALYLTVINLVGLGLGPLVIGIFNDRLFRQESDVRYSLALVIAVCAPLACALLCAGFGPYRRARTAGA